MNGETKGVRQILVDTDVLIDVARGIEVAITQLETLASAPANLAISVVTRMELIIGCRNRRELQVLEQFIAKFEIIKLNDVVSDRAIELLHNYRLSHGLLIADALIAATALVANAALLSKNQRDYRFIQDLNLLPYP